MRIRAFEPGDEPAVVSLWRACGLVVPWNDPHEDIRRKMSAHPELFLVAEIDGRVVGSVMAGWDGHRGWLNYLAVDPGTRRSGVGRSLVQEAESRLAAQGCPKVNLQVRTSNRGVLDFYRRIGYSVDDVVSLGKRLADV